MLRALAIRHVPFEDLGTMAEVLGQCGYTYDYVDAPVDGLCAVDPLEPDLLIVLGGPIGVYEDAAYPFIRDELVLLEQRLAAKRPTLGICLGCQLMARALGARIYPGPLKEIGWMPVKVTDAGRCSPLQALQCEQTAVLHWHGDTFDLPEGAVLLASTDVCTNQAFSLGHHALGLQFHIEVTAKALEGWLVGHACEIAATSDVTVARLRADARRYAKRLELAGRDCMRRFLQGLGQP